MAPQGVVLKRLSPGGSRESKYRVATFEKFLIGANFYQT